MNDNKPTDQIKIEPELELGQEKFPEIKEPAPSAYEPEAQRKSSSAWKWLLFVVLLLGLGYFVATSPSFAGYWPSETTSRSKSTSSRTADSTFGSSANRIESPSSDSILDPESYLKLTIAIPVMIAILTFLTFLNTLLFLSMSGSLSNIRGAIEDIYDKIT